ncbi:MAG: hypothetical protein AAFO29_14295, partial [Actinomycetota bacterium]
MRWLVRAGVGGGLVLLVLLVTVTLTRSDDGLPDDVAGLGPPAGASRGPVYLVEIASRPDYRLIEHDLDTGTVVPRFVVPETGVVYSMAPSPDGDSLVLAYSDDYTVPGTGLYRLPPIDGDPPVEPGDDQLLPLVPEEPEVFFDDLGFGPDPDVVWASREEGGASSVVSIDLASGEVVHRIDDAVEPAVGADLVAFLVVEDDQSRRSIGLFDPAAG